MRLQPATIKLSHDEIKQIVSDHVKGKGWRPSGVILSTFESGHNGPTYVEATVVVEMPTTILARDQAPPADAP